MDTPTNMQAPTELSRSTPDEQPTPAPSQDTESAVEEATRRDWLRVPARVRLFLWRAGILAAFLLAWEALVSFGIMSDRTISRPVDVYQFLIEIVPTAAWWRHTWVTVQAVISGVLIGGLAGTAVGLVLGTKPLLSRIFDPYITMLNSLPRIALFPLMLTWFGIGIGSKVAIVVGMVFFIMLINTRAGVLQADEDVIVASLVLGARQNQQLRHVLIPSAIPQMFAGLRLSIAYGLMAAVAGELIASFQGLGQRLSFYSSTYNIAGVMGVLVFLAVFATALNYVTGVAERRLLAWRE